MAANNKDVDKPETIDRAQLELSFHSAQEWTKFMYDVALRFIGYHFVVVGGVLVAIDNDILSRKLAALFVIFESIVLLFLTARLVRNFKIGFAFLDRIEEVLLENVPSKYWWELTLSRKLRGCPNKDTHDNVSIFTRLFSGFEPGHTFMLVYVITIILAAFYVAYQFVPCWFGFLEPLIQD